MLRLALYGLMLAAPFITYGAMAVRQKVVVASVRAAEKEAAKIWCSSELSKMETEHNRQVQAGVDEAERAGEAVQSIETDAELKALCAKSASCRDRGRS